MADALAHTYRYAGASGLRSGRLRLASSAPAGATQPFLDADIRHPRAVALALRAVSDVVGSRHHWPAAMLDRILSEADPVLTWGTDRLRVEGFSACCGIYARADLLDEALDPRDARHGTTNVDFNAPMRAALARIRDGSTVRLSIADDGVALDHDGDRVVERTVALPVRWLRGFGEVQAVQRRMEPRFDLDRASAVRFLRTLPRSGPSYDVLWVVPAGRGVRVGGRERPGAVRLTGVSRLRALEPLLPVLRRLEIYADPRTGASAWRVVSAGLSVTAVVSPEVWRGFSGEGQLLEDLAAEPSGMARIRAHLAWQAELHAEDLARVSGLPDNTVPTALSWLAARGLAGFDVATGAWFHRELPFDLEDAVPRILRHNRRLADARDLVAGGHVRLVDDGAEVRTGGVLHRVRLADNACTCPWWARHRGERGPCKHVLAAHLVRDRP